MSTDRAQAGGDDSSAGRETATIGLPLPIQDPGLFKHGATPHVLQFLSDNPEIDVSIRQLSNVTPVSERATREAVDTLEANELLETFHEGNARRVHINRSRLEKPDDPIQWIPQPSFRTPVRVAKRRIEDAFEQIRGIVLFGSVARGEADRRSDIDLWVLVEGDHMQHRHTANDLATRLGEIPIPQTIPLEDVPADSDMRQEAIDEALSAERRNPDTADRYSFEIVVETPQSIVAQTDRIDAQRLFGEGITLHSTATLERVKQEVLDSE